MIFRQAGLPFSEEDKVQMLRDDNRHLKEENAALKEEIERMRRLLFGSGSEKLEKGDWIVNVGREPQAASQSAPDAPCVARNGAGRSAGRA